MQGGFTADMKHTESEAQSYGSFWKCSLYVFITFTFFYFPLLLEPEIMSTLAYKFLKE